jgi:hypothetical protein
MSRLEEFLSNRKHVTADSKGEIKQDGGMRCHVLVYSVKAKGNVTLASLLCRDMGVEPAEVLEKL